jgi:iron complex outermembrane receptor protein
MEFRQILTVNSIVECKKGIISFFHIGYTNSIVNYNGQKSITVSLGEDANQLEVVIQVGYGTVKKKT